MGPYIPFLGVMKYFTPSKAADPTMELREYLADNHKVEVVAYNLIIQPFGTFVCVINGQQALKDWLSKEADCSVRRNQEAYYPGIKLGFFGDNTRAGLAHRSIYTEHFDYKRVHRRREPMTKILNAKMDSYVKDYGISKTDYKEVDVRDFLERIAL